MKTTVDYLDELKQRLALKSDYALAKWLGCDNAIISNYRLKKRVMDDYTGARIADALEIDRMLVIAAANYEREKDEKKREYWKNFLQGTVVGILSLSLLNAGDARESNIMESATNDRIYIMRKKKKNEAKKIQLRAA